MLLCDSPRTTNNSTMQFPQEINCLIGGFIIDEVQATDPQCYRAARSLQAAWRAKRIRRENDPHACDACGEDDGQRHLHSSWTCDSCRLDYMIQMFEDGAVAFSYP